MTSRRRIFVAVAVATALLAVCAVRWLVMPGHEVLRTDFVASYMGGSIVRGGHARQLYDSALQASVYRDAASVLHGYLPFNNPPVAALLVAPLTALPVLAAFRVFSLLQALLVAAAAVVAVRAAPWPPPRAHRAATAVIATATAGTYALLLQGQWDGVVALGLALGYADLRRDRPVRAGVWLTVPLLATKPHLAIGVAAFLLGWRERRVLLGAVCGCVALAAVSLLLIGADQSSVYAHQLGTQASRWPLATLVGVNGLAGSWLGDVTVARLLGVLGTVAAAAAAVLLGGRQRAGAGLEWTLGGAIVLSLLGSPHLYLHDLPALSPVFAWCAARAATVDAAAGASGWPGRAGGAVLGLWVVLDGAAATDFGNGAVGAPGRLVPWVLIGGAVMAIRAAHARSGRGGLHARPHDSRPPASRGAAEARAG